jgi:hypothetical protein
VAVALGAVVALLRLVPPELLPDHPGKDPQEPHVADAEFRIGPGG